MKKVLVFLGFVVLFVYLSSLLGCSTTNYDTTKSNEARAIELAKEQVEPGVELTYKVMSAREYYDKQKRFPPEDLEASPSEYMVLGYAAERPSHPAQTWLVDVDTGEVYLYDKYSEDE